MRSKTSFLAVAVLAVLGAAPAVQAQAKTPQTESFALLQRASKSDVVAAWQLGLPRFVTLDVPVSVAKDDAVERALVFLETYRDLYRLAAPRSDLYLARRVVTGGGEQVFFGQRRGDVPVEGAYLRLHVVGGSVRSTAGHWSPGLPPSVEPSVAAQDAEARAVAQLDKGVLQGQTRLSFYDDALFGAGVSAPRLAWKAAVFGWSRDGAGADTALVFVDAQTGAVLRVLSLTAYERSFDIRNAAHLDVGPTGCGVNRMQWFDENGRVSGIPDGDGWNANREVWNAYDFFANTFGHHSYNCVAGAVNCSESTVLVFANAGSLGQPGLIYNARWTPACRSLSFGEGFITPDVFAHEFTHGVTHFNAGLHSQGESGALNESYSDVFGVLESGADWEIGRGLPLVAFAGCGNKLRNMKDPTECGDPDHYGDRVLSAGDNGGVHTNSGIPNKVAALLSEGGDHHDVRVVGIGREKLGRLYYDVLVGRLGQTSTMRDARDETVTQAQEYLEAGLHGFTVQDVCSTIRAFESVGLGPGDRDCDGIDDVQELSHDVDGDLVPDDWDNCPAVANHDQRDTNGNGSGDACDDDDDSDGRPDDADNCPLVANRDQYDNDHDGIGEECDDDDGDGFVNTHDNCRKVINWNQSDVDSDGLGDACDPDRDDDGLPNEADNCPLFASSVITDDDQDGVGTVCDNCPYVSNPGQADLDRDGMGDACDADRDGDGVNNLVDNCPDVFNPDQIDTDRNGAGLTCDAREMESLYSAVAPLRERIQFPSTIDRIRIPVSPCAGGCPGPDWIAPGRSTEIRVGVPNGVRARLVDTDGLEVAASRVGKAEGTGSVTFRLHPQEDSYFNADHKTPVMMRRYFVELTLEEKISDFELTVEVVNAK